MARQGRSKPVGPEVWQGRLRNARDFHQAANDLAELWSEGANGNPVVTHIVNAAIAYADALTARYGGFLNQQDHRAVVAALRSVLEQRADAQQLTRLRRILEEKDSAAYGARRTSMDHARELLEQLSRFAAWVEAELARP